MSKRLSLVVCLNILFLACAPAQELGKAVVKEGEVQKAHKYTNALSKSTSRYLLQHAHNPIDWNVWGDEAFAKAKKEQKPIFLSIGYSSCHWCHVMEHESFTDEKVAAYLNENFICIKVDREERPDVDEIYMSYVVASTGSGGWPMSVWLTPDLEPFYGGTYFPPEAKYGRSSFMQVSERMASIWKTRRAEVVKHGKEVVGTLKEMMNADLEPQSNQAKISSEVFGEAVSHLLQSYDETWGGYGDKPKFPQSYLLSFLLTWQKNTPSETLLNSMVFTEKMMASGGMYDHVGGGFHRYSVDEEWHVPHFEKMLYDNATLIPAYLELAQQSQDPFFAEIAQQTADFVLRDMTGLVNTKKEGAFFSSIDADGPGGEGFVYVWKQEEIDALLKEEDAKWLSKRFGLDGAVDFSNEEGASGHLLKLKKEDLLLKNLLRAKPMLARLHQARQERAQPVTDDKVLTEWNGMMIRSLCELYQDTWDEKYLQAAQKANVWLEKNHWSEGQLLRSKDAKAVLADYAYFGLAQVWLYKSTGQEVYLKRAEELAKRMDEKFSASDGAFLFAQAAKDLLTTSRPLNDGALPSGNAVAAEFLLDLSYLSMDASFAKRLDKLFLATGSYMRERPRACVSLGKILLRKEALPRITKIEAAKEDFAKIKKSLSEFRVKEELLVFKESEKMSISLCIGTSCHLPVSNIADFKKLLEKTKQ